MELLSVERGEVAEAFAAHVAAPHDVDTAVRVFELHPFVRRREPQTVVWADHTFAIVGYSLNIKAFAKWLKTPEGAPFKSKAGGMSDDGLYTVSPLLRRMLPRGFHRVEATNARTGAKFRTAFVGLRKFTGLGAGDEDEESNSTSTWLC